MDPRVEMLAQKLTPAQLARLIDHTYLKPPVQLQHIKKLCDEANKIGSYICIPPSRLSDAQRYIWYNNLTRIRGIEVVGAEFPHGELSAEMREDALAGLLCAHEHAPFDGYDMVANRGYLKDRDLGRYRRDIELVAEQLAAEDHLVTPKVIQENSELTDTEKQLATRITAEIGAKYGLPIFAKTGTGFGLAKDNGAKREDVVLMREILNEHERETGVVTGIKPAGGIGDIGTALSMIIAAGGTEQDGSPRMDIAKRVRLGTSAGMKIVTELEQMRNGLGA